jgi:hypothetical protein
VSTITLHGIGNMLSMPARQELVRRVLDLQGLAVLYGPPGSYKSFLALALALGVARGLDTWLGAALLASGPTIYVAAEGGAGLRDRVLAWCDWHQPRTPPPLYFVLEALNMRDPTDVEALIAAANDARCSRRWL